jgi:hypothetical protein
LQEHVLTGTHVQTELQEHDDVPPGSINASSSGSFSNASTASNMNPDNVFLSFPDSSDSPIGSGTSLIPSFGGEG